MVINKFIPFAMISSLFTFPSLASAQWEGNWLFGLSGGYNWYEANVELDTVRSDINHPIVHQRSFHSNDWFLGALGGYQLKCGGWLFGTELNFDWADNTHDHFSSYQGDTNLEFHARTHFTDDATIALSVRAGYNVLCWLMPYARVGIETSRNKLHVGIDEHTQNSAYSSKTSNQSYRLLLGAGLEAPIAMLNGVTLRLEYNYQGHSQTLNDSHAWDAPVAAATMVTADSHVNTARVALVYNFGY